MKTIPIKRALLSVYDKTGLVEFAQALFNLGVELISTGGTSEALRVAGIIHRSVDELTEAAPMLDGRVKTLHPKLHGGILGKRDKHADEMRAHGIQSIDLVVVNFYPFSEALQKKTLTFDEMVEYIDIGGPTMVRAAAKNCAWVGVVIDPLDYFVIINELQTQQGLSLATRVKGAEKAFATTSQYDSMIHHYFTERVVENNCVIPRIPLAQDPASLKSTQNMREATTILLSLEDQPISLRYGENPHQAACAYRLKENTAGILSAQQYQGKPLSFNNMLDLDAALNCLREFSEPTAVIVKHGNPCGVATRNNIDEAYRAAYEADSLSAFGGVIALNRPCTEFTAEAIANIFIEGLVAPGYAASALTLLATKPNVRVLENTTAVPLHYEMKGIVGGLLLQERDWQVMTREDLKIVTALVPSDEQIATMLFAWRVLKHIKSNAILIAKSETTVGIGAGQVSRVDAVEIAIRKAGAHIRETILASDAFFPFRDSIDCMATTGIRAIIQPGGSKRDDEVITACNEQEIAMVFTGKRCFKH